MSAKPLPASQHRARRTRRAPSEKRAALLSAARALFSEQGYDKTSTLKIARRAGVSEGILFHHFGSKKGLLDAIANSFIQAGIAATTSGRITELTEESVVRGAFDFADTDPGIYELLSRVSSDNDGDAQNRRSDAIVQAIEQRLREAIDRGLARAGDPHIMARLQFILVDGAYRAWRRDGRPALRERYIRETIVALKAMMVFEPNQDSEEGDLNE